MAAWPNFSIIIEGEISMAYGKSNALIIMTKILNTNPIKILKKEDINIFELNEAFASQSLAVVRNLELNQELVNVNGGAIALGHPLGCTGAKLTVQMMNELKRRNQKYGVVTMCVGTGQGAAGVFEML